MAYSAVPVDINEDFSVSQPKITANFIAINTAISVDHETFDAAGQGKHKQVTFPQQTVAAGTFPLATSPTEMQIYSATDGANPALFLRRAGKLIGVATDDINFTTKGVPVLPATMPGYCWLPCGIKMIWGTATIGAGVRTAPPFTFTDGGFPTAVITVMVTKTNLATPSDAGDSVIIVSGKTLTQLYLSRASAANVTTAAYLEYLAIGY